MLDFHIRDKPALTFEGDTSQVVSALATQKPVHWITTGGGMGGATSAGLAVALEALGLTTQFSGNPVSVGVINQLLAAYGKATELTHCYHSLFCSPRFIKPGAKAYVECEKVDLDYYAAALRYKLRGARPVHAQSTVRIGLTNYETGEAVTVAPNLDNVAKVVRYAKASAYIPAVCKGKGYETIDGVPYVDGGISQPIPLLDALQQKHRYLVVLMSTPKEWGNQTINRWIERSYAERKMSHLPVATRQALLDRHELFQQTLQTIRSQLKLPIGHPARYLPPTAIVWPTAQVGLGMVEQRHHRVEYSLGAVYKQWWMLLREEKNKCVA